jgi:pimeloyl-ACP methyl ester carboxylesterase
MRATLPRMHALLLRAPRALAVPLTALALLFASACSGDSGPGRHFSTHGIRMYYEVHGTGSPVLLLHGGTGNGKQFEKQLPAFTPLHRCIVPDCCAQGRTTDRPGPLTYHAMAEDMIALLDHLHVKRVDIMGWSDGGNIGLDMAMHHPERVDHLVTFGANFQPDGLNPQDVAWNNSATAESFGAGMRSGWTAMNPQPDHYEQAMNKIIAMWRTLPNWSLADLHTIRAKALICAGDHDLIRQHHTEELAHAIPGAEMWIVPNASHSAMVERWEIVNPRVLEFFSR